MIQPNYLIVGAVIFFLLSVSQGASADPALAETNSVVGDELSCSHALEGYYQPPTIVNIVLSKSIWEYPRVDRVDVNLGFCVSTEGKATDVQILSTSYPGVGERVAIRTLERWTFTPALLDGNAVEVCECEVEIDTVVERLE